MANFTFAPTAVGTQTATTLPVDAPKFSLLTSVLVVTLASTASAPATADVVATISTTSTPAGTSVYYNAATRQWTYGQETTEETVFAFAGPAQGERPAYS